MHSPTAAQGTVGERQQDRRVHLRSQPLGLFLCRYHPLPVADFCFFADLNRRRWEGGARAASVNPTQLLARPSRRLLSRDPSCAASTAHTTLLRFVSSVLRRSFRSTHNTKHVVRQTEYARDCPPDTSDFLNIRRATELCAQPPMMAHNKLETTV